ncbi:MAG: hypothetical protein DBY41_05700 [Clostridium sp.]|nr:MAG: hypothetical protein DBY41_05700 [Clostridium sp.]
MAAADPRDQGVRAHGDHGCGPPGRKKAAGGGRPGHQRGDGVHLRTHPADLCGDGQPDPAHTAAGCGHQVEPQAAA